MIRVTQVKLTIKHTQEALLKKLLTLLHIKEEDVLSYTIRRQSIDARKKPALFFVYTIDVEVKEERKLLKRHQKNANISKISLVPYVFPSSGERKLSHRPVVVGSGPAGLFCTYMLAKAGYKPLLIERGASVKERIKDVETFWETGELLPNSNVQFGEGGAGTFSDGKLNTVVKDSSGRNTEVLELFVKFGAPAEILYVNKPHIGTDLLCKIIHRIRTAIIKYGGEVRFHTQLTNISCNNQTLESIEVNHEETIKTEALILALGHSARDTFEMLYNVGLEMQAKSFALGVRIEHPQSLINQAQYGMEAPELPAADYKLTAQLANGRSVYTFCMCPGGYVLNASSEDKKLAINGMSYHARDGENANSAVVVNVTPKDYKSNHPLAGLAFQRSLEEKAFRLGNGCIPIQRFEDYCKGVKTTKEMTILSNTKGKAVYANIRDIFPQELQEALEEGIYAFDKKLRGFASKDAILSAVESRTSSPIRIPRKDSFLSSITGVYPCGEGAGYAGGITSAAIDGLKVAEAIASTYANLIED
jgi:Uncharacterized FAD-dependent dehydrogenases